MQEPANIAVRILTTGAVLVYHAEPEPYGEVKAALHTPRIGCGGLVMVSSPIAARSWRWCWASHSECFAGCTISSGGCTSHTGLELVVQAEATLPTQMRGSWVARLALASQVLEAIWRGT